MQAVATKIDATTVDFGNVIGISIPGDGFVYVAGMSGDTEAPDKQLSVAIISNITLS